MQGEDDNQARNHQDEYQDVDVVVEDDEDDQELSPKNEFEGLEDEF